MAPTAAVASAATRQRRRHQRTVAPAEVRSVVVLEPDTAHHPELLSRYRSAGLDTSICVDAFRAVLLVAQHRPDAVVMSAAVPVADAVRTVAALRSDFTVPTILAMTGADAEQLAPVILAGALPIHAPTTCIETVVSALAELPTPRRHLTPLTVGALSLDPTSRQVTLAGRRLHLAPTEFTVLHVLAEHADDLVTKQVIMASCWPGRDVTGAAVGGAVARLRQHLAGGGGAIRTVRRLGYLLDSGALTG